MNIDERLEKLAERHEALNRAILLDIERLKASRRTGEDRFHTEALLSTMNALEALKRIVCRPRRSRSI